jgi:valyl-tRNA synthetase
VSEPESPAPPAPADPRGAPSQGPVYSYSEERWAQTWEQSGLYHYDPARPRAETFVIDTPPPTVSGSLHIGHVFSYTQADVLARQRRMRGLNLFYPMGWDDNGLPTERRVQNLYHVRVDVRAHHEPTLRLEPATAEARRAPPRAISRPAFIDLCRRVTAEDEKAFEGLWRRIGLSVDWRQRYATIDDHCRRIAQRSFLDLFAKGHLYSSFAPTMWDIDYQTAVAQAEVEERPSTGAFHEITFAADTAGFTIATTRPELLPACVGVAAHPDDPRHNHLIGQTAFTPLFRAPVPIFASTLVDPLKGTGILMVCTFGDATDVTWWREQGLALRQVIGRDGRLLPVRFGEGVFISRDPEAANRAYGDLAGKTVKQARAAIVEQLRDPAAAARPGQGPPLRGEPRPIERAVKFFEKGDQPLEILPSRQWFVRLLDKKEELLAAGDRIRWHPDFMRQRYRSWVEGLQQDWCISRQRYFGVPFPVWYPHDARGLVDHQHPLVAAPGALPVDPTVDAPLGHSPDRRAEFTPETDVFDTWFVSSMTPQIMSGWPDDPEKQARLYPGDLRPQSHEIIRTWAFYTIAKSLLHERSIPWTDVAVSGWILDPDRKKMSKSKGNVVTPMHLIDNYSADGVRYWAASARLGTDTAFDEKVLRVGKRLATKLWNAARLVPPARPGGPGPAAVSQELDRALLHALAGVVDQASAAFASFDYASALATTETFFWRWFTDTYLELVKGRLRQADGADGSGPHASAVASLRLATGVLLRLFAPVLPFVTEEIWSQGFAAEHGHPSIHRAPWPQPHELTGVPAPADRESLTVAAAAMSAINKSKSGQGASVGRLVTALTLGAHPATLASLRPVQTDLLSAVRSQPPQLVARPDLAPGVFEVLRCDVAPSER